MATTGRGHMTEDDCGVGCRAVLAFETRPRGDVQASRDRADAALRKSRSYFSLARRNRDLGQDFVRPQRGFAFVLGLGRLEELRRGNVPLLAICACDGDVAPSAMSAGPRLDALTNSAGPSLPKMA